MYSGWANASDKVLSWLDLYKGKPVSIPSGAEEVARANLTVVDLLCCKPNWSFSLIASWLLNVIVWSYTSWYKSVASAAAQTCSPGYSTKRRWGFSWQVLSRTCLSLSFLYLCLHCGFVFTYLCFLMPVVRTSSVDELFFEAFSALGSSL